MNEGTIAANLDELREEGESRTAFILRYFALP